VSVGEFERGLEGVRQEFRADVTSAGVQIGAVERILTEKLRSEIKSVKVWGAAALIGGQMVSGLVAAFVGPQRTLDISRNTLHAVGQLLGLV